MAREEQEREDLLADARALIARAEYRHPAATEPIVIGRRVNGAVSLFLGQDPAYHWNSWGELRRAYRDGLLYKSESRQLVALRRERTAAEVRLLRTELTPAQTDEFLRRLASDLHQTAELLADERVELIGAVLPAGMSEAEFREEMLTALRGERCRTVPAERAGL